MKCCKIDSECKKNAVCLCSFGSIAVRICKCKMLYRATLWMMDKTVGSQQDDHMFPFLCCFSRSKVQKHVLSLTKNACRYECERMVCLCVPWWTGDLSRAYFLSSSYSMRPMKPLSMCSLSKVFLGFKHKSQGISTWSIKVFCINGLDQWHWCFNTVLGHIMHWWQTVILSTFTKHGSFFGEKLGRREGTKLCG